MFDDWLPFAIYGFFALVIPSTMIVASFVFATRPKKTRARADDPVRVRRLPGLAAEAALHGQLLPDGDALHPLRHRDRLPLSARRDPPRARWFGFLEFLVFLVILLLAYVYIWRKGALEWR